MELCSLAASLTLSRISLCCPDVKLLSRFLVGAPLFCQPFYPGTSGLRGIRLSFLPITFFREPKTTN